MLPDLQSLFQASSVCIGSTVYLVRPYTLQELFAVTVRVKALFSLLQDEGVTWDNCSSVQSVLCTISNSYSFVENEVCSSLCMPRADFENLPPEVVLEILDKILEVNLKSKELLEEHMKELGKEIQSDPEENEELNIALAVQKLVSFGHPWQSIQEYSLSEIGIFFKTVLLLEREEKKERLTHMWLGSNLEYKGFQEVLEAMGKKKHEESVADINNDWKRLASFMAGRK